MAYVSFAETGMNGVAAGFAVPAAAAPAASPSFSPLEWSVVVLAARDSLASLRTPGRMAMAFGRLFGDRMNPKLADERLEALRTMSVLVRHHGWRVPSAAIGRFVKAGFSIAQFELLLKSISAARVPKARKVPS